MSLTNVSVSSYWADINVFFLIIRLKLTELNLKIEAICFKLTINITPIDDVVVPEAKIPENVVHVLGLQNVKLNS